MLRVRAGAGRQGLDAVAGVRGRGGGRGEAALAPRHARQLARAPARVAAARQGGGRGGGSRCGAR